MYRYTYYCPVCGLSTYHWKGCPQERVERMLYAARLEDEARFR